MSARKPAASRRDRAKAPGTTPAATHATARASAPATTPAAAPPERAPTQRATSQHPTIQRPSPQRPTPQRADGWTPERRATFLESLAEGHTVEAACAYVGLSIASAYALRHREGAEAFALGWRAACLLARDRLADILTSRAIDGQVDTYTRADGTAITRHRHDNRLAMSLLARLDRLAAPPADPAAARPAAPASAAASRSAPSFARSRMADHPTHQAAASPPAPPPAPQTPEAARLAAQSFPAMLALVAQDAGDEALGDFVATQHMRRVPQLPQLRRYRKGQEWLADMPHCEEEMGLETIWQDEADGEVLTHLPPPHTFDGTEYGRFGDPSYARTIMPHEADEWNIRIDLHRNPPGGADAPA